MATLILFSATTAAHGRDAKARLFLRVFGEAVKLDPAMVARVKAAKPGERIFVDRNGDGKSDEAWYIDTAYRHTAKVRPLLVRAIDEDGDLDSWKGPDLDSDLYVVDWKADGSVDVVLDYQDNDGDNDVDEMAFYFYMTEHPYFGKDVLRVWWGSDDGDDNLLWYDIDYTYDQSTCQYRCHFSGDESFVAFGLRMEDKEWVSAFENPFLFYDPDGDTCSEVVLRIEGHGNEVRAIRYSFDADDDAYGRRTHDYDFSITARAPDDRPVILPADGTTSTKLRGIPTQAWLRRDKAQEFVQNAQWDRVLLTWDEMNANTEENVERDPHERWEGIIAHGNPDFKQVGGPPCSAMNKRYELALKPVSPMRLYYSMADRRLHLKGASKGWLDVDYDFDGKPDARYQYRDDNEDGVFERRLIDVDGDGKPEFDWTVQHGSQHELEPDFVAISTFYKSKLNQTVMESQAFIDAARAAMVPGSYPEAQAVEDFFLNKLDGWMPQTHLGEYIRRCPAGARFYADLVRDRLLWSLKQRYGEKEAWKAIESAYGVGNLRTATQYVPREDKDAVTARVNGLGGFAKRISIRMSNSGRTARLDWPVTLGLRRIQTKVPDFNADNCAVVAPERWLDWRQVPHQVSEIDPAAGPELSFLADVPAGGDATYHLYYSPAGRSNRTFPNRTSTAEDWVPPNIGWESNRCAYRAYWGQFDFFGKKTDQLIYDTIGKKSYHDETEWGIDALHVGNASGLGGLTLYVDDKPYLVQNPAGKGDVKFTKKQLGKGPVTAAIEITAENIVPDQPDLKVRILCISYAERQESEIRVTVTGAKGRVLLAPGLVKLPREQAFSDPAKGILGSWGWQEEVIGDIGMAIMIDSANRAEDIVDLPEERRIRCHLTDKGELRYWIIGDWCRGRQHPIAPTVENWQREVEALAAEFRQSVTILAHKSGGLRPGSDRGKEE
ncbi:MAG: DUF4861 family protein [Phycisphaerae bacterium]|nr:DUF4861 family protein [Phycisphaerae bacterium]